MSKAEHYAEATNNLDYDYDGFWEEDVLSEQDYHSHEEVYEKIIDTTRWSTINEKVVKFDDGSYLQLRYKEPATEYQSCYPGYIAKVVKPYEKVIIDYR